MPRYISPARLKYKATVDALQNERIIDFGRKQVFLPKFTVALIRTPTLSPYHARFQVPLNFSKYDIRDYLYHLYSIKCTNIRSFVKQQPVRDHQEAQRQFFREESKKYMTVEMQHPFVWPEVPADLSDWGKQEKEQSENEAADVVSKSMETRRREVQILRDQARQLLRKKSGTVDEVDSNNGKKGKPVLPDLPRIDDPRYKIRI